MTVRSIVAGIFAYSALFASTAGAAETLIVSSPSGAFALSAPAVDTQCCSNAAPSVADFGSAAHGSVLADASSVDSGALAEQAPGIDPTAAPPSDVTVSLADPARPSFWATLVSSLVELGGAGR